MILGVMKRVKALVLFSGGLDSQLVVKILKEQKIEVVALHFILPFIASCFADTSYISNFCQVEKVPLKFVDCRKGKFFFEYLKIIKKPKFGYGKGLNPCLDCRIFILKKAKAMIEKKLTPKTKIGPLVADFIASGEVLGQRPMSQTRRALKLIEKEAKLEGKILRPLSAKLLEETEIEKKELIDRERLYAISGRQRLPQIELAKKFGLKNYPTPAGGCLLCDKEFAKRLKTMLENFKDINENDAELLKLGRHFWQYFPRQSASSPRLSASANETSAVIVVGRNHQENLKIKKLAKRGDILIEPENIPGPTTLIRGQGVSREIIKKAEDLTKKYSKK